MGLEEAAVRLMLECGDRFRRHDAEIDPGRGNGGVDRGIAIEDKLRQDLLRPGGA